MTGLAWTEMSVGADEAARHAQELARRTDPENVERLINAIRDALRGAPVTDACLAVAMAAGSVWAEVRGLRTERDIGSLAVVLQLAWDTRAKAQLHG